MRIYRLILFLACLTWELTPVLGRSIRSLSTEDVIPIENVVIYSPSRQARATNITFGIYGQAGEFRLSLHPNDDILARNPETGYLGDGKQLEDITSLQTRVLKGSAWHQPNHPEWLQVGWARITLIRAEDPPLFEGAFTAFNQLYHFRVNDGTQVLVSTSPQTDIHGRRGYGEGQSEGGECKSNHLFPGHLSRRIPENKVLVTGLPRLATEKRQVFVDYDDLVNTIGDGDGCPRTRRVALVGIVVECTAAASYTSTEELRRTVLNMINIASQTFEDTFNVALGLHNLTTFETCADSDSNAPSWNVGCSQGNMNWRLEEFTSWRASLFDDESAYWTLLTGCPTNGEVGVSWVGQLCNSYSGANVVATVSNLWQVFAHESAHTFGAVHDCDPGTCSSSRQCCPLSSTTCDAGARYIMNPFSSDSHTDFSPCTVGNVCSRLGSGDVSTSCLQVNGDVPTITTGECGNGIVEDGEECDCGDSCSADGCCDGSSCRFRDGAVCDDTAGSCCTNCQFASSDIICRASTGVCDVEETCTGRSSDCPTDTHAPDGRDCSDESSPGLVCAQGMCTNRDLQCQGSLSVNISDVSSCENDSCSLSCMVDMYGSSYCMQTNRQVLDGLPCTGGVCQDGRCQRDSGSGGSGGVSSWVDRNRSLVIGLSAGIGGALVLAILACIICCCRRSRRPPVHIQPTAPPRPPAMAYRVPHPPTAAMVSRVSTLPRYA